MLVGAICGTTVSVARADDNNALYQAYWAGVPAGQIRLTLHDEPAAYRGEIAIRTEGLPRVVTRFRGGASSAGWLAAGALPEPTYYEALYDLRKNRDKHLSMRFVGAPGAKLAERGPADTSSKPPLAESFRRNVEDPISALMAIRAALRDGKRGEFSVPVYDGARRFDVAVKVLPKSKPGQGPLELELSLRPIAGFKGETSEDGDPDDAPRPVSLTISDDARLMPLSMSSTIYYMPLLVQLTRWCAPGQKCGW